MKTNSLLSANIIYKEALHEIILDPARPPFQHCSKPELLLQSQAVIRVVVSVSPFSLTQSLRSSRGSVLRVSNRAKLTG